MIPLQDFQNILKDKKVEVPEESLEIFRNLVDTQANLVLDSWLEQKSVE